LIAVASIKNMETAGVRERSRLQNKNPDKRKWPILKCISLSTKIFYITGVLAGSFIGNTTT
jgi:hypothetical protein